MLNNASSAYTAVNEVLDGNNGADAETDSDDTMGNTDNDDMDNDDMDDDNHTESILSHENMFRLQSSINPLSPSSIWGVDTYASVLNFVITCQ